MSNKLIVFDIDDTLYDEIDYVKSGFQEISQYVLEKYQIQNGYETLLKLFDASSKNVFNRLFDSLQIPYTLKDVSELVDIYHHHMPHIELSKEVIKTLEKLKEEYPLAIVSDGNSEVQKLKCQALNLNSYFQRIILTDELGKEYWKPSKLPFDILSKEFQVDYASIFYIGDNPKKDFYLSQYGIQTIRYYNPKGIYFAEEYREDIKENYRIHTIEEVIELLKQ